VGGFDGGVVGVGEGFCVGIVVGDTEGELVGAVVGWREGGDVGALEKYVGSSVESMDMVVLVTAVDTLMPSLLNN